MKLREMQDLFEKYEDEYAEFGHVENKLSQRRDVHAFILLDRLCAFTPQTFKMIQNSQHDEYYLSLDTETVAANATEEQILELIRCGLLLDDEGEYFYFFA